MIDSCGTVHWSRLFKDSTMKEFLGRRMVNTNCLKNILDITIIFSTSQE